MAIPQLYMVVPARARQGLAQRPADEADVFAVPCAPNG